MPNNRDKTGVNERRSVTSRSNTGFLMSFSENKISEIATPVLISLLYFISGCNGVAGSFVSSLRNEAITTLLGGMDIFIPETSNQFFALECLSMHPQSPDQMWFNNISLFSEVASIKSNTSPEVFKNVDSLPRDPLVALLSLSIEGSETLFSALCGYIANHPSALANLIPNHLRPINVQVDQRHGITSILSPTITPSSYDVIANSTVIPRPGDLVRRGPSWKYGEQDGGDGTIGIVLEVGKWLNVPNAMVKVHWSGGLINSYRYAVDSTGTSTTNADSNAIFDVRILRPKTNISDRKSSSDKAEKENASNDQANNDTMADSWNRRDLAYTPDEVQQALVEDRGGSVTKRSVLLYIKENSPIEWLDKMRLSRPSNSLLARLNAADVSRIYLEFYQTFSSSSVSAVVYGKLFRIEPRVKLATEHPTGQELFNDRLIRFMNFLVSSIEKKVVAIGPSPISTRHSSVSVKHELKDDSNGVLRLAIAIQGILAGTFSSIDEASSDNRIDILSSEDRLNVSDFSTKYGTQKKWNWKRGLWTDSKSSPSKSFSDDSFGKIAKLLPDFSIDRSRISGGLFFKNRLRWVEVMQHNDREWSTCIGTTPLRPNSGVYKWYVRIQNLADRRGQCMFGVATKDFNANQFLGHDKESWGMALNFDMCHANRKRRNDVDRKLAVGSVIEICLDTYRGCLQFSEIRSKSTTASLQSIERLKFDNIKDMIVYPAFSLFSTGDCISIITHSDEVEALKLKGRNNRVENETDSISNTRPRLLGAPHSIVVKYALHLVRSALRVLDGIEVEFSSDLYKNHVLSIFLMQLLGSLCRWSHPPMQLARELMELLIALLERLNNSIAIVRRHMLMEKSSDSAMLRNDPANQGNPATEVHLRYSETLLVQLAFLSSACIGHITKSWIDRKMASIDNAYLSEELLKSTNSTVGPVEQNINSNMSNIITLDTNNWKEWDNNFELHTKWLKNPLFKHGLKSILDPLPEFVSDCRNGSHSFDLLIRWLNLHDRTHPNYRRFGGVVIDHAIRMLFVVNIYHSGFLRTTAHMMKLLTEMVKAVSERGEVLTDEMLSAIKPTNYAIFCWEAAMKLRIWAKEVVSNGLSYEYVSNSVAERCDFLLELEQSISDAKFDQQPQTLTKWLFSFSQFDIKTASQPDKPLFCIITQTKLFVTENISICHIRAALYSSRQRAEHRRDGFRAIRSALEKNSQDIGCGAKCILISSLPLSMKGAALVHRKEAGSASKSSSTFITTNDSNTDCSCDLSGHYLNDLDGADQRLLLETQAAFDSLFGCLTAELSTCNDSDGYFYQLVLLNCLGIRILEQDHTLLSRVKFFYTLQEILDNSLAVTSGLEAVADITDNLDSAGRLMPPGDAGNDALNKLVAKAVMKLFILMALQVATCRHEIYEPNSTTQSLSFGSDSVNNLNQAITMPPPVLRKIKSGPATLSKSVFDILYNQLNEVLDGVLRNATDSSISQDTSDNFVPTLFISPSADLIAREAITLLLCVSRNAVCQKILCRPKWISLLLKMAVMSSSIWQQRAIMLLADLLSSAELHELELGSIDFNEFPHSFIPKREESLTAQELEGCATDHPAFMIVKIMLMLIGNMLLNLGSTPLVCKEGADFITEITEISLPAISEAVALLRKLYCSNSWKSIVESVLVGSIEKALRVSPKSLVTNTDICCDLISSFCVLGGQISAPYRNSPVLFPVPSLNFSSSGGLASSSGSTATTVANGLGARELRLGVFNDFHQSIEKVRISCYKSDISTVLEGESIAGESGVSKSDIDSNETVDVVMSLDKIQAINRCPAESMPLSKQIVDVVVRFLHSHMLKQRSTDGKCVSTESKEETIVKDCKSTEDSEHLDHGCSIVNDVEALLHVSCARVVAVMSNSRSTIDRIVEFIEKEHNSEELILSLLSEAQSPNKSGGLTDAAVYEDYVMVSMRQRQRVWAVSKQTKFLEQKKMNIQKEIADAKESVRSEEKERKQAKHEGKGVNLLPNPPSSVNQQDSHSAEAKSSDRSFSPPLTPPLLPPSLPNRINASSSIQVQQSDQENSYEFPDYPGRGNDYGPMLESLTNMGFPRNWCQLALELCGGDPEEALNYILSNGMQLEEMAMSLESEEANYRASRAALESQAKSEQELQREASSHNAGIATSAQASNSSSPDIVSTVVNKVCHCDGDMDKVLAFYASPSLEAERLGCIYPGDDITIVEERRDRNDPSNVWYKLPYADFDNSFQFYGDDIDDIFVWVPKYFKGNEVIKESQYDGESEAMLASPLGETIRVDKTYRIIGANGAMVRDGPEIGSLELTSLKKGDIIHACEETFNSEGTLRLRIDNPISGWVSKLFGLVQLVEDGANKIQSASVDAEAKEKQKLSEVEQLYLIDDNMEFYTANDTYGREERYFGTMQGNLYIKYKDRSKTFSQSMHSRRLRVSGMSSYHNYLQGLLDCSLSKVDKIVCNLLSTMKKLYCRKILLALILRSPDRKAVEKEKECSHIASISPILKKIIEMSNNDTSVINLFYSFIRMVVFRGEPFSYTGLELLAFEDLFATTAAVQGMQISLEQVLDKALLDMLKYHNQLSSQFHNLSDSDHKLGTIQKMSFATNFINLLIESVAKNLRLASASKFADHSWADSSYEEDLDDEITEQPNLHYAVWITRILLLMNDNTVLTRLFECWILGLRATSLSMKQMVLNTLSEIIEMVRQQYSQASSNKSSLLSLVPTGILQDLLALLPTERLLMIATKRLWTEMEDAPAFSRFLQALIHFLAEIEKCQSVFEEGYVTGTEAEATPHSIDFCSAQDGVVPESSKEVLDNSEKVLCDLRPRNIVRFNSSNSYIQLSPQKEQSGPWTLEMWIYRRSSKSYPSEQEIGENIANEASQRKFEMSDEPEPSRERDPSNDKASPIERLRDVLLADSGEDNHVPSRREYWNRSDLSRIRGANTSEPKLGLTGLLDLLLGVPVSKTKFEEVKDKSLEGKPSVPANYLLSSSKGCIKLQSGGRVYTPFGDLDCGAASVEQGNKDSPTCQFIDDPRQDADPVYDESYCVSLVPSNGTEKIFDCAVPFNKWIHLAIVCQTHPLSITTLYLNGEAQDSIPITMALPLSIIGSSRQNNSFSGDLSEMRVWSIARSPLELKRDMAIDVTGAKNLISNLKFMEGKNRLTHDKAGYFNSCKFFNCAWVNNVLGPYQRISKIPKFMINEPEEAEGLFGSDIGSGAQVVEMTGILRIRPVVGAHGEFAEGFAEVICLSYRFMNADGSSLQVTKDILKRLSVENTSDACLIEGFITWCERNARSRLIGVIYADSTKISFFVDENAVVLGSPESMNWMHNLNFSGSILNGEISGDLRVSALIDCEPPVEPGNSRIDKFSLPTCIKRVSSGSKYSPTERLTVKSGVEDGQYVATVEVAAYKKHFRDRMQATGTATAVARRHGITLNGDNASDDESQEDGSIVIEAGNPGDKVDLGDFTLEEDRNEATVDLYGLCSDQGSYWLEWTLNSNNSGNVAFGVCTSTSLLHPDACVDANDGTWTYCIAGQASHGSNLYICDAAEEQDNISVHVDTDRGCVNFYRNYVHVVSFDDLKTNRLFHTKPISVEISDLHAPSEEDEHAIRGVRPFVSLVSGGDSVTYTGPKFGPLHLTYSEEDSLDRLDFYCQLKLGAFNGFGLMRYRSSQENWFGKWINGREDGLFIRVDHEPVLAARIYHEGSVVHELSQEQIEESSDLPHLLLSYHEFVVERLPSNISQTLAPNSVAATSASTSSTNVATLPTAKITVTLHDSSGENSCFKVTSTAMANKLFEAYSTKRDVPMKTFIFKHESRVLVPDISLISQGIENNAVIEVSVRSINLTDAETSRAEVEEFIANSNAPFVIQIVYESGALVRTSVEIETPSVRTLRHGDVIEAFRKSRSSDDIGRFRIADGWISEKLRGGSEARVVRILAEKLTKPNYYKVVREEGARVRQQPSLSSPDVGFCPHGVVITVKELRYIGGSSLTDSDGTMRAKIESPVEWRGWASVKEHIIEKISDEEAGRSDHTTGSTAFNDPAIQEEIDRREVLRRTRKVRRDMMKAKEDAANRCKRNITVEGSLSVSQETFFLLRKKKLSGNISISNDFTTVTCDSSASGRILSSGGGRSMVLGSRGFTRGIHYWEVQVNAASWGSVFIGVAPEDSSNWNGYGFLNYRATQAFGCETLYGSYFSVGDKVGVLLDMDHGTISFFKDGEDFNFGKVRVVNMGVAYHNLRRISSRISQPVLFPCFGVKMHGDQLSIRRTHWVSTRGLAPKSLLRRVLHAKNILINWNDGYRNEAKLSKQFVEDAYKAYMFWSTQNQVDVISRPGIKVTLNTSADAIQYAAGDITRKYNLKVGKVVKTQYGESIIIGARNSQLWYTFEGGETGAWYWMRDELQDLLDSATISFDIEPSAAALEAAQRWIRTDKNESTTTSNPNTQALTYEEFDQSLINTDWSAEDDGKITRVINSLSSKFDMDPYRISGQDIMRHVVHAGIIDKSPADVREAFSAALARYTALCVLNKAASIALPLVDFNHGDNREPVIRTAIQQYDMSSISPSTYWRCSGDSIVDVKKAIFTQTKMAFWNFAITETTTPTAAPADEYERPDDLRELNINRVEARNAQKLRDRLSFRDRLRISVFGQLLSSMQSWDERSLRRAYIHMQDAGQARAFFVKFTGEGVDDQGGPYRAVFQTAVDEESTNLLELLHPSPNALAEVGEQRDKYLFHSQLLGSSQYMPLVTHFGKIIAMACRHDIMVALNLPTLLWKPLCGEKVTLQDLQAVDSTLTNSLRSVCDGIFENDEQQVLELLVQALSSKLAQSNRSKVAVNKIATRMVTRAMISRAGEDLASPVPSSPDSDYYSLAKRTQGVIDLIHQLHLTAQTDALQYLYKGFSAVLPIELLPMFTAEEVEGIFCGEAEVDIDVLQKATTYESVSPTDSHIQYFWEAVRRLDPEERSQLINFCSGRSRLPAAASDFPMNFKLTSPPPRSEKDPDDYLPIARTCFFSLSLPKYSSIEVCLAKLKYAIRNTELMDADFIDRRGTSGWENVH